MRAALIAAVVAVATLSNCKPAPPPEDPEKIAREREDAELRATLEAARADVRRKLRDPESARFRKGSVATATLESGRTVKVICGYVNAKNAFGGYVGEGPWFVFELWDGSRAVCPNLKDCNYALIGGGSVGDACLRSLGE